MHCRKNNTLQDFLNVSITMETNQWMDILLKIHIIRHIGHESRYNFKSLLSHTPAGFFMLLFSARPSFQVGLKNQFFS